jgi:PadR family transcriptional regulator PadR
MPKGDWLGEFEVCVLLAVAQLDNESQDAYGLRVRKYLEAATGRQLAIGAVYNTLARLKEKGLLRAHVDGPRPVQGGRTRSCFHLTPAGSRALKFSTSVLTRLMTRWNPNATKS